jgi:hypothetical protein
MIPKAITIMLFYNNFLNNLLFNNDFSTISIPADNKSNNATTAANTNDNYDSDDRATSILSSIIVVASCLSIEIPAVSIVISEPIEIGIVDQIYSNRSEVETCCKRSVSSH